METENDDLGPTVSPATLQALTATSLGSIRDRDRAADARPRRARRQRVGDERPPAGARTGRLASVPRLPAARGARRTRRPPVRGRLRLPPRAHAARTPSRSRARNGPAGAVAPPAPL